MKQSDLKPCPFCGKQDFSMLFTYEEVLVSEGQDNRKDDFYIHCNNCGAMGPTKKYYEKAVECEDKVKIISEEIFNVFLKHAQNGLRTIDAISALHSVKSQLMELHFKNSGFVLCGSNMHHPGGEK